jgi:hypothetical protein
MKPGKMLYCQCGDVLDPASIERMKHFRENALTQINVFWEFLERYFQRKICLNPVYEAPCVEEVQGKDAAM